MSRAAGPAAPNSHQGKRRAANLSPATEESTKRAKSDGKKRALSMKQQTAENGVILKIVLQNFMNHAHMQVDLDPHVNFILGPNGSGKSAIVASCIAGLGCKASATGRNLSSYKHFIMHGMDYALVQIHLANGGHDPYRHDEFGDVVVVEHRIEKSGGGAYRLKSADGRVDRKATKREVEELNLHYNIQADNPCSLLTQEAAKKFLHNGNEEDRYRFFLSAANLGTLKQDLMNCQVNLQSMQEKTEKAQQKIPEFEEYARQAKEEYDGAQQLKRLQELKEQMEPMVAWAQVAVKERELADLEEEARAADEGVGQAQQRSDALQTEMAGLEEKRSAAEAALGEMANETQRLTTEALQANAAAKEAQKRLKQAGRSIENASAERSDAQQSLEEAKVRLSHLETTLKERQQALVAEREAKRRGCVEQKAHSEKEVQTAKAKVEELKQQTERLSATKGQDAEARAAAKEGVQRATQELKDVSSQSLDILSKIHPNMPDLVAKVGRTAFSGPVVGPLGAHVELNPGFEHLALAAEGALRGCIGLSGFLVTNPADEVLLRKLAKSLPPPPRGSFHLPSRMPVLMRPAEPRFALPKQGRMKTDHPTLFDAVTVLDDNMHNYFLDCFDGGQYLLFATAAEAKLAVWHQPRPQNAPRILRGISVDPMATWISYSGGTQTMERVQAQARGLLMSDQAARKQLLEQQLQQCEHELTAVEQQLRQVDEELKRVIAEEKTKRRELISHQDKWRQAALGLKELDQADADEALTDIEMAREDVRQLQDRAEQATADEERWRQEKARAEAEYQPLRAQFDAVKASVLRAQAASEAQQQQRDAAEAPIRQAALKRRRLDRELAAAKQGGEEKRADARVVWDYIQRHTPQIEKAFGPRVDDPEQRSVDQLKRDYEKANNKLEKAEKKHGGKSLLELQSMMLSTAKKLQERKEELTICDRTYAETKASFAQRYRHFCKQVKNKGNQAALDFNLRLSRKQHAGTLKFDHDAEQLSLDVQRNSQDSQAKSTSDARNLSGGERSFTTLSFELAMWEFCETPFRVLDEFDVYMDDTYRKIAVDTLLEICESQPRRQFIFITPQDMHPFLKGRQAMPRIIKMDEVRPATS